MSHTPQKPTIGLLTLPLSHNYGGILQLVALQEVLDTLGFRTLLLDRRRNEPAWKVFLKQRLFYKYALSEIERFKKNNISAKTAPLVSTYGLKQAAENNGLTAIMVGSDQVWRPTYTKQNYKDYFLDFCEGTTLPKIAYAASFGENRFDTKLDVGRIRELLQQFTAVSVREASGKRLLFEIFNFTDAAVTIDPTLLLPRSYYEGLMHGPKPKKDLEDKMFYYVLDDCSNNKKRISEMAKILQLETATIRHRPSTTFGRIFQKKIAVESWLQAFQDAAFVVTDSYHGMLFSIIFEKPFFIMVNHKRGASRFESLAEQLGLKDRLIYESIEYIDKISTPIDYRTVQKKLAVIRADSIKFLTNALPMKPTANE